MDNQNNQQGQTQPTGKGIKVPSEWPGAFAGYKLVRPFILPQIWNLVGLVVIDIIVGLIIGAIFKSLVPVGDFVSFIVGALFEATLIIIYISALKGQSVDLAEAIKEGSSKIVNMALTLILVGLLLVVSFILLVVPFFFVLPRVCLAPILLINNNLGVGDAISTSWEVTRGNVGKVYGIIGLQLLIALLFITIIGIPFAIYFGLINEGNMVLLAQHLSEAKPKTQVVAANA